MRQLELLWGYQQADQEVDRYEAELMKDPTRQRLLKLRNIFNEQQAAMAHLESDAEKALARMDELTAINAQVYEDLSKGASVMEEAEFETSEDVREVLAEVVALQHRTNQLEKELAALSAEAGTYDDKLKTIRLRALKAKNDYDELKKVYDEQAKEYTIKLTALKAAREEAAGSVQPEILARYKAVKQHRVPPMAKLLGDQCGGCNMNLPSVVLRNLKAGDRVVECENCGRILMM